MVAFLMGILLAISMNTLVVVGPHKNVAYELRWPCLEEAYTPQPETCYLIRYKNGRTVTGP